MAFFERADEFDQLVSCNICSAPLKERSLTQHKSKCAERNKEKFTSGQLVRCEHDSGHYVKAADMALHLEFCTKRQNNLRNEYQREIAAQAGNLQERVEVAPPARGPVLSDANDDWGAIADSKPYVPKMRYR